MKEESGENRFVIAGTLIIAILVFAIIILLAKRPKEKTEKDSLNLENIPLNDSFGRNQQIESNGKYKDKVCGISFNYPKNWQISSVKLTLPQPPLSQITFNEPGQKNLPPKNSIFSFICYDAQKYSFDQFVAQNPFSQNQVETITAGSATWQRAGNFVYAVKNNKLYIFQMFFTKNDLKPESGYEEIFLNIIKSVQ